MHDAHLSLRLFLILLAANGLLARSGQAQTGAEQIRLNQIGFYPEAPKVAVVVEAGASDFYVLTADLADTVFIGTLSAAQTWVPSEEMVQQADFSQLQAAGVYVVHVPGLGHSYPFEVAPAVHEPVARAALKAYYFQRASTALDEQYAGPWARAAGHPDTQVRVHASAATEARPEGTLISAPRGWYDAGDYNKYIVNSGISMGTLLMLYEHFPTYYQALTLTIPESDNAVPDLLDEILWNLRWMLAMQDPNDGGVYHKLTTPNFEGMVMPAQANQPRYVVQKGTAATLDFAAVTAMAARIFNDFEDIFPGLADSSLAAAQAAWTWALDNPGVPYQQNQINQLYNPDIVTGAYGDGNFADEFRWAATELYITTGDASYLEAVDPLSGPSNLSTPGWPDVGTLAYFSLAHHRQAVADDVDTTLVKNRLLALADGFVNNKAASAYDIVMGRSSNDFFWGSNSYAGNQGLILIQAYRLTGDDAYLYAALANLDYLLGRNATGYSFMTGYGDRTPMHIHHRPSEADGVVDPVPGLLSGGPNSGGQDIGSNSWECDDYRQAPASTWIDHVCSYASNEITINWNAPLAYLAGGLEVLLSETGVPVFSEGSPDVPEQSDFALVSYPNPAHSSLIAAFELAEAAPVTLIVYDLRGRAVAHLAQQRHLPAGRHTFSFDSQSLPSGVYLLRLHAGTATATQSFVVTR